MSSSSRYFAPIDFKTRFPALDGIRALAVTMVFFAHYGGGSHGGHVLRILDAIRKCGWMGVDIFFVLSGFLITGILFDTRNDPKFFRRFFARRTLRIFPVFYLVFAVLLLLTPIFQYQWRWQHFTFLLYIGNFFANRDFNFYTLVSGNHPSAVVFLSHLWSLCVEEQFYLLWPIAVWAIRDRVRLLWTAGGISLCTLLARVLLLHFHPVFASRYILRTLVFRLDTLLIGAMLALLLRGPGADWWQRHCKWALAGCGTLVAILLISSSNPDSPRMLGFGLTVIALASAGLIGATLRPGSFAFRLFYLRPLRIMGKYSYGFYIYHLLYSWAWIQFLIFMTQKTHSLAIAGAISLTSSFVITFLVSKLSYDLFEVRFLQYKKHFEYDSEVVEHKHAFTTK